MIGQDAVRTAKTFHDRLAFTGVVMTKLDGDARGGAALSVKSITGAPLRSRTTRGRNTGWGSCTATAAACHATRKPR